MMAACLCILPASAQLSSNPNKFLGNITTSYQVDAGGGIPAYYKLWNQITCENESKWASVEGSRGKFNWGCDNAFNYAINHNFPYKFHALVWGAQYPSWLSNLSPRERFSALTNWFDHVKEKYNTLPMIDVVNEAVGNHQAGNPMMKETLGGGGKTGYDWLIKAFEMAYERWPDAILIYNDYNSFRWDVDNYITLVQTLRDAGAPIDAYGNQAHDLGGCSANELSNVMQKQQDALKMPMYVTEYDIGDYEPETHGISQKNDFMAHIPVMWEAPYCAGVTLWGYVYGKTWIEKKDKDGNVIASGISGLYIDGVERPAMTWLKEYMATDAAKNAVGPFPGAKKEASIYIRPASQKVAKNDILPIIIRTRMATKTIEKIDFYVDDELVVTLTEAPYRLEYRATKSGWKNTKAVVTTTDGTTYERYGRFQVLSSTKKRAPYNDVVPQLPGIINVTKYDEGASGVTYNNATRTEGNSLKDAQWMDYTVDVVEDGYYSFDAEVASSNSNGRFHLAEYGEESLDYLTEFVEVPNTGDNNKYETLHGNILIPLKAGRHIFSLMIDKGGFCMKNIEFKHAPTFVLPGTIEAEDFFQSGTGMSVVNGNGGSVLSNTGTNVWTEYFVNISTAGKYSFEATVSSAVDNSRFSIGIVKEDGTVKNLISIPVPNTGGLDHYQVMSDKIKNSIKVDGLQTMRITVTSGKCNIDKIKFICTEPATGINEVMSAEATNAPTYNLLGVPVNNSYHGIAIKNGKKVMMK